MAKLVILWTLLFISLSSLADGTQSKLGIDYEKASGNKLIAEVMLEMESSLIEYYSKGEYEGSTAYDKRYALKHMAYVLGQDHVSENTHQVISDVAPDIALKFLKLDKEKHPDLWSFGEYVRLSIVEEESRRLYKALHGKEYEE